MTSARHTGAWGDSRRAHDQSKGMQLNKDQEAKIAAIPEIEKELAEMKAKLKSLH
jgi:hypothetical protein